MSGTAVVQGATAPQATIVAAPSIIKSDIQWRDRMHTPTKPMENEFPRAFPFARRLAFTLSSICRSAPVRSEVLRRAFCKAVLAVPSPLWVLERMVQAFSTGDTSAVREFVSEDYVDHQGLGGNVIYGTDGFEYVVMVARSGYRTPAVTIVSADTAGTTVEGHLVSSGERNSGVQALARPSKRYASRTARP
jgi:hypothetical protein